MSTAPDDELVFAFAASRGKQVIEQLLGVHFCGTLIADGYAAYAAWVQGNEHVTLAQCWVHTRRQFVNAHDGEEQAVDQVLEIIGRLYRVEDDARKEALEGELLREHRLTHAKSIVDEIYAWRRWQCTRGDLLPSEPFTLVNSYSYFMHVVNDRLPLSLYTSKSRSIVATLLIFNFSPRITRQASAKSIGRSEYCIIISLIL